MNVLKWFLIGYAIYCGLCAVLLVLDYWRFLRTGKSFFLSGRDQ